MKIENNTLTLHNKWSEGYVLKKFTWRDIETTFTKEGDKFIINARGEKRKGFFKRVDKVHYHDTYYTPVSFEMIEHKNKHEINPDKWNVYSTRNGFRTIKGDEVLEPKGYGAIAIRFFDSSVSKGQKDFLKQTEAKQILDQTKSYEYRLVITGFKNKEEMAEVVKFFGLNNAESWNEPGVKTIKLNQGTFVKQESTIKLLKKGDRVDIITNFYEKNLFAYMLMPILLPIKAILNIFTPAQLVKELKWLNNVSKTSGYTFMKPIAIKSRRIGGFTIHPRYEVVVEFETTLRGDLLRKEHIESEAQYAMGQTLGDPARYSLQSASNGRKNKQRYLVKRKDFEQVMKDLHEVLELPY